MGGLVSSKTALICAKVLLTYVLLMLFPRLIIGVIGREKLVNNVVTGHGNVMVARIGFGGESNIRNEVERLDVWENYFWFF